MLLLGMEHVYVIASYNIRSYNVHMFAIEQTYGVVDSSVSVLITRVDCQRAFYVCSPGFVQLAKKRPTIFISIG